MHTKVVPHSGNVLQRENLMANLVNYQQFGKLKPSEFVATINNLLVKLFIRQKNHFPNFYCQSLHPSTFTKHYS